MATRSAAASNARGGSSSRPSERVEPNERGGPPRSTGVRSRLVTSACTRRPLPRPSSATSSTSLNAAASPTVAIPRACSLVAVARPIPHSCSIACASRNPRSSEGRAPAEPSGFAARLAILAAILVDATPTVMGSPTSSRTRLRSSPANSGGPPGTPPRCHGARRAGTVRRRPRTAHGSLPHRPPCAAPPPAGPGTAGAPHSRASHYARRTRAPHSSPPSRPRWPRPAAFRAGAARRVARRRRRSSQHRHGELTRTYVRMTSGGTVFGSVRTR